MTTQNAAAQTQIFSLQDYQWQNRLLLIRSPANDHASVVTLLESQQAELADRDMRWFVVGALERDTALMLEPNMPADTATSSKPELMTADQSILIQQRIDDALAQRPSGYQMSEDALQILLIGKDGGNKWFSTEMNFAELYATIDAMPMRRREMQRAN